MSNRNREDLRSALQIPRDRPLAFYGTGITALGTVHSSSITPDFWIDDNPLIRGKELLGCRIHGSEVLDQPAETRPFVVTTASKSDSVRRTAVTLARMGYRAGRDYLDCSDLHFHTVGEKLRTNLGIEPDVRLFQRVRASVRNSFLPNHSTITGSWLFSELLMNAASTTGATVAECGAFMGGNAYTALVATDLWDRCAYHLFDSFEGFGRVSGYDPPSRKDDFQDAGFDVVTAMFADLRTVTIHKGFFEETLPNFSPEGVDLVYVDCDLYEPTKYCWNHFEPSVSAGALFLVHDCWIPGAKRPDGAKAHFEGVAKALAETVDPERFEILEFPETTHAIVRAR